ncbi:uncharacterized protein DUF3408 [Dysgonomonas alginatilytica]|uniref:Uncharacterized protein DUF3408 n=1 Tax=Dysgonomonas alginatilytica TaxID=1605892 RepID=A0A2V3PRQ5_9BACT|nr:DUF3408 domain-containing protein [Dysgonomonas alginatilytica]PXV60933.1 uncharacterized protein DUF3408 [Dysgonomonas alginatilytica]
MKENDKTEKKSNVVINANAFITQMPFTGMKTNTEPLPQTDTEEGEMDNNVEAIQSEVNTEPDKMDKQSTKRKKNQNTIDYPTLFLSRYELRSRQGIYIEKETNETIKLIVHNIGDARLTVSGFIENVLKHHFELFKDEINQLYESRFRKPIK